MKLVEIKRTEKIYSQNCHVTTMEELDDTRICDPSGYIPLRERIEAFMRAGENLEKWREQAYDYEDEDLPDSAFDLADFAMRTEGADVVEIERDYENSLRRIYEETIPERREKSWHTQKEQELDQGDGEKDSPVQQEQKTTGKDAPQE